MALWTDKRVCITGGEYPASDLVNHEDTACLEADSERS